MNGFQIGNKRLKVQLKKHRMDPINNVTSSTAAGPTASTTTVVNNPNENQGTTMPANYSY